MQIVEEGLHAGEPGEAALPGFILSGAAGQGATAQGAGGRETKALITACMVDSRASTRPASRAIWTPFHSAPAAPSTPPTAAVASIAPSMVT